MENLRVKEKWCGQIKEGIKASFSAASPVE